MWRDAWPACRKPRGCRWPPEAAAVTRRDVAASRLPRLGAQGRAGLFGALVALGCGHAALVAAASLGVRALFDGLQSGPAPAWPNAALASAIALAGVSFAALQLVLLHAAGRWGESLGQRYAAAVRTALLSHLFRLAPRQHQQMRHGHLMARMTGDLTALQRWIGRALAPLLVGAATLLLLLVVLTVTAPLLALLLAATLAPAAAVAWWLSLNLEQRLRLERKQRWALAGQVGERLAEAAVVQAHGQAERELRRLDNRQQQLHASAVARSRWSALLKALPTACGSLMLGTTAAWGAWQVSLGVWTPGSVAGMLTLLGLALAPARDLALGLGAWRAWRVSREKLDSFLRLPELAPSRALTETLAAPEGALHFEPGGAAAGGVHVPARGTLAVHGPSGSGKSALLQALAGQRADAALNADIDGQALARCRPASIARHVALVAADLPLLRGTIGGNLRYRAQDVAPEAQWEALARVGLDAAVRALPQGLLTPVREGGRNLPLVMRHRLALARALMGAPAVLLIDDFDLLLEGDAARDAALEDLLLRPRQTTLIATRSETWRRLCAQSLDLNVGATPRSLELVHVA